MYYVAFVDDLEQEAGPELMRNDLDVYALRITEQEGELAACELEIVNPGISAILGLKSQMIISRDGGWYDRPDVLFRGTLIGIPTEITGDYVTLELLAKSGDTDARIDEIVDQVTVSREAFDPIYYGDEPTIVERLSAFAAHVHVDRRTLSVGLSDDLANDTTPMDVGHRKWMQQHLLAESAVYDLQMSLGEIPPSRIVQRVSVEWTQTAQGSVEMGDWLTSIGRWEALRTYTPDALAAAVPGLGSSVDGGSGYQISVQPEWRISSERQFATRGYSDSDLGNPIIRFNAVEHEMSFAEYRVSYDYEQPRRETLVIEITSPVPTLFGGAQRVLDLPEMQAGDVKRDDETPAWRPYKRYAYGDRVQVNGERYQCARDHRAGETFFAEQKGTWNLLNERAAPLKRAWSPSFFETVRATGWHESNRYSYTTHPVLVALAAYKRALRFVEISASIDFETGLALDCNSVVTIESAKLPGGSATGKVISTEITDSDGTREARITIAVALGSDEPEQPVLAGAYAESDYANDGWQMAGNGLVIDTFAGLSYAVESDDVHEPVSAGLLKSANYLVRSATSENMSSAQLGQMVAHMSGYTPQLRTAERVTESSRTFRDYDGADVTIPTATVYRSVDHDEMSAELAEYMSRVAERGGFMPQLTLELRDLTPTGTLECEYRARARLTVTQGMRLTSS